MTPVYTIGHSDHSMEAFLALLRCQGIDAVADVRSQPFSRHQPHFNEKPLRDALAGDALRYVFLGQHCGARSPDPACYRNGQVVYERLAATTLFQQGLERIRIGAQRFRLALLCAEKDPLDCHRAVLVSRHLHEADMKIEHIHADGALESQDALIQRMRERVGLGAEDLFHSDRELTEMAYATWGERIAYHPEISGAENA